MISFRVRQAALIIMLLGCAPGAGFAGDLSREIIPHRALWPDPINSAAQFDRASRAEILIFAHVLAESETLSDQALQDRLHGETIDIPSIQRVRQKFWKRLSGNYAIAAAGCRAHEAFCPPASGPIDLHEQAEAFANAEIPPNYRLWSDDATRFYRAYLDDQLRLAAVFPRFDSEVETLNDNEWAGWKMQDRHFLLTFDDGPTLQPAANAEDTDLTLDMLRNNEVNAVFSVMGGTFQARLRQSSAEAMKTLYSGMCVEFPRLGA